jgi:parallel beta-helix repeat protein
MPSVRPCLFPAATILLAMAARQPAAGATFVVANTFDSGAGSLRQAILDANANPGPDTVAFALGAGGPFTISPTSNLPDITGPLTIDGSTQAGYVAGGPPRVVLDGALITTGTAVGLRAAAPVTIRALCVQRFTAGSMACGIQLAATAGGSSVEDCFLGTDAAGATAAGNRVGVLVGAADCSVRRCLVSGNTFLGIWLDSGSSGCTIAACRVGTDAAGAVAVPNPSGLGISGTGHTIGGPAAADANQFSGNSNDGIHLDSTAAGSVIRGNLIGTNASGAGALPNGRNGVRNICSCAAGATIGPGNTIAFNGDAGVRIFGVSGSFPAGIAVLGNSIHSNGALGIDLTLPSGSGPTPNDPLDADAGPNGFQNYPVLHCARSGSSATTVRATLSSAPSTTFRIEFFSSPACDASGFGEGRSFLGSVNVATDAAGSATLVATLPLSLPVGHAMTATATDPLGNTSELSACATIAPPLPADRNGDGAMTPADVATFVSDWFASLAAGTLAGDFDNSGTVNPADIAAFINAWTAAVTSGC